MSNSQNIQKTTIAKLISNFRDILDESIIEELIEFQKQSLSFDAQISQLHLILFSEESDSQMDSFSESQDRKHGINPMNLEYQKKVNRKRVALGVTALNPSGMSVDRSTNDLCDEIVRRSGQYKEAIERKKRHQKEIVYVDMDNVLVDFKSGIETLTEEERIKYDGHFDEVPGIFSKMRPNKGAIEAYQWLTNYFDVYILSTAPWENSSAWSDKLTWVRTHLEKEANRRLILSHHKNLLKGQYIIDDRTARGVSNFEGKHIHFGQPGFENWDQVILYLKSMRH